MTIQINEEAGTPTQTAGGEASNTQSTGDTLTSQLNCDTLDHESGDDNETPNEKRRGPTLMTHIWNQPKEKRIVVRWNKYWQPLGDERSDLAYFLGTIARNPRLCSLAYTDWRLVPQTKKDELLNIVKSKFVIPHPLARKYVMQSMGKKWSNFKGELKLQHYEPYLGNITKILKARPDYVPKDQWSSLVTYWNSSKGKGRSEKNRKSREQQVMAHTGGSKSFACYTDEKTVNGVVPSRAIVYLDTHKERRIMRTPMDAKSKQAVDMINSKLRELPNGVEETNGRVAWDGDIYSQVMNVVIGPENKGRVRGLGRGPKSLASISGIEDREYVERERDYAEDDHDLCDEKIEFLECKLKKMQDKLEQAQKDHAAAQSEMRDEIKELKTMLLDRRIFNDVP